MQLQSVSTNERGLSHYTSVLDQLIDPVYQIRLLWQHKWEIAGMVFVVALLGALLAYTVEPKYRSTVSLMIQPTGAKVAPITDVMEHEGTTGEYLLTHHELLRSRELAGRVVDHLELTQRKGFTLPLDSEEEKSEPRWKTITKGIPFLGEWLNGASLKADDAYGGNTRDPRSYAITQLRKMITIETVIHTYIVRIHADTKDPLLSAEIANALVDAYVTYGMGERLQVTEQASGWLTARLTELKKNLADSEKKLQDFYENADLVNIGGARQLLAEDFSENSERLRDARRKKAELASIYNKIKQADGDLTILQGTQYIEDNDLIIVAKQQYFEARERVSELSARYGEKHPRLIAAKKRLDETRGAYENQVRLATQAIKSQYEIAINTERALGKIQADSRQELQKLDRRQHSLEALQHEVETNRRLFDSFLQRYKETDIAGNLDDTNNRVIDRAEPALTPFSPNKKLWVLAAGILGFLLAYLVVLIRVFLDDTIKTSEDMEGLVKTPVLATLPKVSGLGSNANKMARIEIDDPRSVYAEAIRTLRTSIMLADAPEKKKVILIASSVPSEGKTCISANLAISFGQLEKTLLIDCDLRKPSSAKYLSLQKGNFGLVEVLAGHAPISSAVTQFGAANIDVLSCTQSPPNPSELLGSQKFQALIDELGNHYDRIIIDSPPCQVVSDALLLARSADAVIFVTKASSTYRRVVAGAVDRLAQAQGKILGTVLNEAVAKKNSRYGDYYYSEYYGV